MADAGVNAYLVISEIFRSEGRNIREKIASLMWIRLAKLLKSRGALELGEKELFSIFDRSIASSSCSDGLTRLESIAEDRDGDVVGDFWAAFVFAALLVTSNDEEYGFYVIDRYISFAEKFYNGEIYAVEAETELILNAVSDVKSDMRNKDEKLMDYIRRMLSF